MRDSASVTEGLPSHMVQAVDVGVGVLEGHTVGKQADIFLNCCRAASVCGPK